MSIDSEKRKLVKIILKKAICNMGLASPIMPTEFLDIMEEILEELREKDKEFMGIKKEIEDRISKSNTSGEN